MTKLEHLLLAASSGALRDGSDTSLTALVAEVRRERARMYRRACAATKEWHDTAGGLALEEAHYRDGGDYSVDDVREWHARASRHFRAMRRIDRILRGLPAFGGGK